MIIKKYRSAILIVLTGILSLNFQSCQNDDDRVQQEQSITLDTQTARMNIGDELLVTPQFSPNVSLTRTYSWENSNREVINVTMNEDYSILVRAISKGNSTLTFSSIDGELQVTMEVSVDSPDDDGVLKILTIGNSFSEDAAENYLYDLAKAAGIPIVIGNLFLEKASLEIHRVNTRTDAAVYDYGKTDTEDVQTNTPDTSIAFALADEDWDFISIQQVIGQSGIYESFVEPLPDLLAYVKEHSTNPEVKYILHQPWAYSSTSSHSDFSNYNSNQEQMYTSIVDAVRKAQIMTGIDYVVPVGTAIQNGRSTFLGESFTRNGDHLSLTLGKYTAASTWFDALTGIDVIGNTFAPAGLTEVEMEIAQHIAHAAVVDPDRVTNLPDYAAGGPEPLTAHVLVNFGHRTVAQWNSLTDHHEGASIANLKDENDNFTNIALTVTQRFNSLNETGENDINTLFEIPDDVSSHSYYGNYSGVWQDLEIKQSQLKLSGLDPNTAYNLCFFSSRAGVDDNREAKFIVVGDNSATLYVNASSNKTETACGNSIHPDSNGEITITVTAGENNDNGFGFYYLNALRLSPGQ